MAVVIARSRATAHVVRIFAALVALLLIMAVSVAVLRLRGGHGTSSPYGALPSVGAMGAQHSAAVPAAKAAAVPTIVPASQPSAIASTDPLNGALAGGVAVAPAAVDPTRMQPRVIALDRASAGSTVPQPAPAAVVQAAVRAAAAAPQSAPASPQPPSAAPAVPAAVAVMDPAPATPEGAATAQPPGPGGLININTATAAELDGVGAGHIGRTIVRHRPYRAIEELLEHRVLKASDFARIRGAITTN